MTREERELPEPAPEPGALLERRDAIKAVVAAGASLPILNGLAAAQGTPAQAKPAPTQEAPPDGPRGTPSDPDLLHPRADWPRLLRARELATLAALCDMIIPADERSPSASAVGVPAYINEVASSPYDTNQTTLIRVRGGLAWLNLESRRRFGRGFTALTAAEKTQICDDICYLPKAEPQFRAAARFFDLVRDLCATGFYTTRPGMADLRYLGNVALPRFEIPREVLDKLGL